jgi:hypothetical protein
MDSDAEENEYEYVYSNDETDTCLIQLDLSTLNDSRHERLKGRDKANARQSKAAAAAQSDGETDDIDADEDSNSAQPTATAKPTSTPSLQILDLHTQNPIVAHRGAFYSCAWHDLLGTDMFFAPPHQPALEATHTPLRKTNNYNLLGTSRIRLVGRRAKVSTKRTAASIGTAANKKARLEGVAREASERNNELEHEADAEDPRTAAVRAQTDFLERLRLVQETRQARETARAQARAAHENADMLPE